MRKGNGILEENLRNKCSSPRFERDNPEDFGHRRANDGQINEFRQRTYLQGTNYHQHQSHQQQSIDYSYSNRNPFHRTEHDGYQSSLRSNFSDSSRISKQPQLTNHADEKTVEAATFDDSARWNKTGAISDPGPRDHIHQLRAAALASMKQNRSIPKAHR